MLSSARLTSHYVVMVNGKVSIFVQKVEYLNMDGIMKWKPLSAISSGNTVPDVRGH